MFLKRYFWAINLALITLFIWASVDLFLAFLSAKLDQRPLPRLSASTDVPPEPDKKPRAYFAMLTSQNIFDPFGEGHLKRPEVAAQQAYVPPPPPPLSTQLRLKGTVAGGPDFGIAIVDDVQSRRQEVVKLGGRIRNALLLAVTRTGAVFDVGGRQETLALLEKDVGALPAANGSVSAGGVGRGLERPAPGSYRRGPVSPAGAANVRSPAAPEAEVVRPLGSSRFAVNRQKANQMAAQPGELSGQGKLGAGSGGLTLNDLPPGGLAEKAGLQSGDVLKRINGEPVSNPAQALQAYQKALSSPAVKLEVVRSNRPMTLTYELN